MLSSADSLKAPFPWFGGKSRVAHLVWNAFGQVPNYVEPFAGSLAVYLRCPYELSVSTLNDKDAYISNFWRAVQSDPEAVAHYADWPVNENDLHARHIWLVQQKTNLVEQVEGDPHFYDAKIAGWWVWGICCWIGGGFCYGDGPWTSVDGRLVHLGNTGQGVHRKRVHLGTAGKGVHRQRVHMGDAEVSSLTDWMQRLAVRLRRARVANGDWTRVLGPSVTVKNGLTGVFLDPPYSQEERDVDIYREDTQGLSDAVREWSIANGDNPQLRIALCGYEGEHAMPKNWEEVAWKPDGGYGNRRNGRGRENRGRERIWFSPHCLPVADRRGSQIELFS